MTGMDVVAGCPDIDVIASFCLLTLLLCCRNYVNGSGAVLAVSDCPNTVVRTLYLQLTVEAS